MEITYYTNGVVWVTNKRVVIVDTTYWLYDIEWVRVVRCQSGWDVLLWLVICLCSALLVLITLALPQEFRSTVVAACILVFLIPLGLLSGVGIVYCLYRLLLEKREDIYLLRLKTGPTSADVFASYSREQVEILHESVEHALDRYWQRSQELVTGPLQGQGVR
jgi:hypothetical protein